jgi:hypothetical protein
LGFTLDQLLETTGVGDLSGRGHKKVAAKQDSRDLLKLAERCRRAAETPVDEPPDIDERALTEKTAAVQIIRRTLAEIRQIEDGGETKVASVAPTEHQAAFIKAALEAGHDEESIARFLEDQPGRPPARPEPKPKKTSGSIIR